VIVTVEEPSGVELKRASSDSWFWPAAIFDPRSGRLERLLESRPADMSVPSWTANGRVLTIAQYLNASIWRYRRE
jgi:hypothetical protein